MLPKNFMQGFNIMFDAAFNPKITEQSLEHNRAIIQREREEKYHSDVANPYYALDEQVQKRLYSNTAPLVRSVLGTKDSIDSITTNMLREYHSKYFVGNNLVVTIKGDLDEEHILEKVKNIISTIPAGEYARPFDVPAENPYSGTERIDLKSPIPGNAIVNIYFQVPPYHSKENSSLNVLSYVLGGSMNSILFYDMREKNRLVYSIRCGLEGSGTTGLIHINYTVKPDDIEESLKSIDSSLDRLKRGDFDHSLVEAAKASSLPALLWQFQEPGWICNYLEEQHAMKSLGLESTSLSRIKEGLELNSTRLIDVARKYLGDNKLVFVTK